ncbi:MAG: glycerol-3-phosphate acyltransferase [Gudongella sp.]|nr:glycerol-3-phosphate acyltransferase [Gudongella sp.]
MENLWPYLITAAGGYLIGSISFARLVFAKLKPGQTPDLIRTPTTDGKAELVSHAIGATNVMIAFGARWGMVVSLMDALKGFLPTLALLLIFPDDIYHLVVAVSVLIGHLWPIWYRFSGGGGNSSIMGMLLAISPLGLIITHLGGMLIGNFVPMLAFIGGIFLTIPWFAFIEGVSSPEVAFAFAISILYLLAELPEMLQLRELKRKGHELDHRHVMSMMKKSAKTGDPVKSWEDQDFEA